MAKDIYLPNKEHHPEAAAVFEVIRELLLISGRIEKLMLKPEFQKWRRLQGEITHLINDIIGFSSVAEGKPRTKRYKVNEKNQLLNLISLLDKFYEQVPAVFLRSAAVPPREDLQALESRLNSFPEKYFLKS